jgi:hypothetical protein
MRCLPNFLDMGSNNKCTSHQKGKHTNIIGESVVTSGTWFSSFPHLACCYWSWKGKYSSAFTHRALSVSLQLGAIKPSDSDFGQDWKPGTGEIPLLFPNHPNRCVFGAWITDNPPTILHLINQSRDDWDSNWDPLILGRTSSLDHISPHGRGNRRSKRCDPKSPRTISCSGIGLTLRALLPLWRSVSKMMHTLVAVFSPCVR